MDECSWAAAVRDPDPCRRAGCPARDPHDHRIQPGHPPDSLGQVLPVHGPALQMATLRFDLEDGAKHALRDGRFAIVPGDPANSQLIQRITSTNPAVRMPRSQGGAAEGEPLTERQIALLTRWIEQGAAWQKHWSFNPPTRPELPKGLKDANWVRNPIDAFVLERLEREGLKPSPEADRPTLLRRVSLDLT